MEIRLTLKNARLKSYHVMSWIIILLNTVAHLTLLFTLAFTTFQVIVLIISSALLLIDLLMIKSKFIKKKNQIDIITGYFLVIWVLLYQLYWVAALNFVLHLLYLFATRRLEIRVSNNKITYPSFPKRNIKWSELQNVIMRGGLLTIDFKNNKLLQAETETGSSFTEKEFNEFCREQLKK